MNLTGIGIDNVLSNGISLIKKRGKVKALEDEIAARKFLSLLLCHFHDSLRFFRGFFAILLSQKNPE